ncbi:uncharacterized protein B0H18DRAFT_82949 [Fomitopsis serialis]|uniref:uncharacterized protein n=1 Tax=Fomitopsis serialis TaxID=139415 RepID=UPI002008D89B|nr:uncharacterized protein B0H18DRAFT_82949 [Neoantrodia serialis]KAH9931409.1 hypothetical protein B0H18DRAFT_82949 [Neoantrodia serialis]
MRLCSVLPFPPKMCHAHPSRNGLPMDWLTMNRQLRNHMLINKATVVRGTCLFSRHLATGPCHSHPSRDRRVRHRRHESTRIGCRGAGLCSVEPPGYAQPLPDRRYLQPQTLRHQAVSHVSTRQAVATTHELVAGEDEGEDGSVDSLSGKQRKNSHRFLQALPLALVRALPGVRILRIQSGELCFTQISSLPCRGSNPSVH